MELNSKNIKKILLIIFLGTLLYTAVQNLSAVFSFFGTIISVLSPIIVALCIAFILNVFLTPLETKVFKFMDKAKWKFIRKAKRPVCLVLTYLVALGIIVVLISVIIPDIIDTIIYIAEKLPSFMVGARDFVEETLDKFNVSQDLVPNIKIDWSNVAKTVTDYASSYSENIFNTTVNSITTIVSTLYTTIFSIMISVYILAQKERIGGFITKTIDAFIPERAAATIYYLASRTNTCFSKFIGGQLTESVILGTIFYIVMTIFGFPNAAIISIFICVTSLVPIIGATVGCIVGAFLIFISSPIKAIIFVLLFLVIQQIEGTLIYPKVVGKSVGLPGVIVVCAVLVGGNVGGIAGAFVGVPLAALGYTLLKEAVESRKKPTPKKK